MGRAFLLVSALGLPVLALLAGCGDEAEGLDHDDPMAVFRATMAATHDGEWDVLRRLLTPDARAALARDLDRIKRRLAHPKDGENERLWAHERFGEEADEAIRRVTEGGRSEALRFAIRLMPRERIPRTRGIEAGVDRMSLLYVTADGTQRPVRLVRTPEGWRVADLQL